jgi:endoglucanase
LLALPSRVFQIAVLALVLAAIAPAGSSATPPRVQVGGPSSPSDTKIAIVGSDKSLAGKRFTVLDEASAVVLDDKLAKAPGKPDPWRHAHAADLSSITTPGSYTVEVGNLASRPWIVESSPALEGIDAIVEYFRSNRDGSEPSPIHDPAHLNDAVIHPDSPVAPGTTIDIDGGWMDAGDMLHFTQTTAFATAMLDAAGRLVPGSSATLFSEADVGVRWLLKAHPSAGVFVAQVGDERDHDLSFRDPATDDASSLPGIGTRFAYPSMGGDLGGKAAAALALSYMRTANPAHLQAAKEWYAAGLAAEKPAPPLKKAGYPRYAANFYAAPNWKDSMATGAAELYRATCAAGSCDGDYQDDFIEFASSSQSGAYGAMGAVDDFASYGAAEVCGAFGDTTTWSNQATNVACGLLADNGRVAVRRSRSNAFGMAGYFTFGTTAQNGAAGALAALATSGPDGNPGGCQAAAGARDYLLGRNPFGASFVVGYGQDSAQHPHHWASVFDDGLPMGAVVGGPGPRKEVQGQGFKPKGVFNKGPIVYEDKRADYVTSEPAIDYSASSILLLAALDAHC